MALAALDPLLGSHALNLYTLTAEADTLTKPEAEVWRATKMWVFTRPGLWGLRDALRAVVQGLECALNGMGLPYVIAEGSSRGFLNASFVTGSVMDTSKGRQSKCKIQPGTRIATADPFSNSTCVVPDSKRSCKGLTDAAARGDTTAQSLLAQDYFYGANGVRKDVHTGVRWATVAAEAGDRDSQELLAVAFGRGHEDIDVDVS
ncbi:unnamed protein product [Symbiodinium sp. CCMP2592]|nr:unnamed protein product [Symbiodinium sp. CCMP2592]